jgi:hypothetical protein
VVVRPACAVAASTTFPAPVTLIGALIASAPPAFSANVLVSVSVIGALIVIAPLASNLSVLAPLNLIAAPTVIGAFGAVVRTTRLESSVSG